jgi:hypothetical protein
MLEHYFSSPRLLDDVGAGCVGRTLMGSFGTKVLLVEWPPTSERSRRRSTSPKVVEGLTGQRARIYAQSSWRSEAIDTS